MIFPTLLLAAVASAKVLTADLFYLNEYYETIVEVGTPPQKVRTTFDTGSGHLWIKGTNSTGCATGKCPKDTLFNVSDSSTWRYELSRSSWGGHGNNGRETVHFAGAEATDFITYVTTSDLFDGAPWLPGIFGQSPVKDTNYSYVQNLAQQGVISRAVFAVGTEQHIVLNDKKVSATCHYGGYDAAKFEGPMATVNHTDYSGIAIPGSIQVAGKPVANEIKHTVVLDTGGIYLRLTENTMNAIATHYGGGKDDKGYHVDCSSQPEVEFKFGVAVIPVELKRYFPEKNGKCYAEHIAIVPDNTANLLEGPDLISSAYVIYDHDRQQIHIAKARYTDETDVREITGDIPGAIPA